MSELGPGPEETGGEDWQEPIVTGEESPGLDEETILALARESALIAREVGESGVLTVEQLQRYQEIWEAIIDQGPSEERLTALFDLAKRSATLKWNGGLREAALKDLHELADAIWNAGDDYADNLDEVEGLISDLSKADNEVTDPGSAP